MGDNKQSRGDVVKKVAIGSAVAAAAGYIAGVLTAPKSGKQTRQDLKAAAEKSVREAEKDLKRLYTELSKVLDDAKKNSAKLSDKARQELDELLVKAKDTKEKVREILSAVHEGDAGDADLQKAIKEANDAIDHLKVYLKKEASK